MEGEKKSGSDLTLNESAEWVDEDVRERRREKFGVRAAHRGGEGRIRQWECCGWRETEATMV